MKDKYWWLANIIFFIHVVVVLVILFGWYFPQYRIVYLSTLILTLVSEITLGYCVLTKWEFDARKKLEPGLNYDYGFLAYYAHKLFKINVPRNYIKYPAIIFLAISIVVNLL